MKTERVGRLTFIECPWCNDCISDRRENHCINCGGRGKVPVSDEDEDALLEEAMDAEDELRRLEERP
jgi:hypothetical protein